MAETAGFVDGECRHTCTVACDANERILNTFAIGPGGNFVFEEANRATFRPQRQGASVKVVLACCVYRNLIRID
jgi:hypothetical protein